MSMADVHEPSKSYCAKHWKWWLGLVGIVFSAAIALGVLGARNVFDESPIPLGE